MAYKVKTLGEKSRIFLRFVPPFARAARANGTSKPGLVVVVLTDW